MQVTIGTLSGKMAKALQTNSQANSFALFEPQRGTPTYPSLFPGGQASSESPRSVFLMPYGEGDAGRQFSLRLYGLTHLNAPNQGDPKAAQWIPFFIVELLCTLSNLGGNIQGSKALSGVDLIESERLCDGISLTQGDLGVVGRINSPGAGSGLISYATVDLVGCRMYALDFQQVDAVGMNCLLATL